MKLAVLSLVIVACSLSIHASFIPLNLAIEETTVSGFGSGAFFA